MKAVSLKSLRKNLIACSMAGLLGASLLSGCGQSAPSQEQSAEAPEVETEVSGISELQASNYVTAGDYKDLSASVLKKEDINDDVVTSYMEYVAGAYSSKEERPEGESAELGDTVNIDFEGKKDGVAFDGGTAQGFDLVLGSGQFIEGFEDGLVGAKKGETRDLDLTFPENYGSEELAGAAVVFTVKVNSISVDVSPELNDDFVKTLNIDGVTTLDEYREYTRSRLEEDSQKMYNTRLDEALLANLLEKSSIKETPSWLVDHYDNARTHQQQTYAEMSGMSIEDYAANYYGCTLEEFQASIRGAARNDANILLLIKAVAEKENISVTEDEVQAYITRDIEDGGFADEEELMGYSGYAKLDYEASALKKKVLEVLKATAKITDVDSYDAATNPTNSLIEDVEEE